MCTLHWNDSRKGYPQQYGHPWIFLNRTSPSLLDGRQWSPKIGISCLNLRKTRLWWSQSQCWLSFRKSTRWSIWSLFDEGTTIGRQSHEGNEGECQDTLHPQMQTGSRLIWLLRILKGIHRRMPSSRRSPTFHCSCSQSIFEGIESPRKSDSPTPQIRLWYFLWKNYILVYKLKQEFPNIKFTLNGGVKTPA